MGASCSGGGGGGKAPASTTHTIHVKTGDKKGASSDGNIFVSMQDETGKWSDEKLLDTKWKNDFEAGRTDVFHLSYPELQKVGAIRIRRDETRQKDDWYLEKVVIEHRSSGYQSVFPVTRWITASSEITIQEFDSSLPADDKNPEQRAKELERKRSQYQLTENEPGLPKQVLQLPDDERFSNEYKWDIIKSKVSMLAKTKFVSLVTPKFENLSDFEGVYDGKMFPVPQGRSSWQKDEEFGNQRLSGCNPSSIELCTRIPDKFAVTGEMLRPFLEEKTLEAVIETKKLYIVDLTYLKNIECNGGRKLPGPLALFYSNNAGYLVPIAIQLMPEPSDDNPVFLPSDPQYTWLAAKMWFNLADCSHHQSTTHLGHTHLLLESVAVCTHRNLSPSHPLFKTLAPHFLYLLAINTLAVKKLVSPDGWVDETMHIGRLGMFGVVKKNWADWDLKTHGNLLQDLKRRGVDDETALPNYHYRDDAKLLWNAIHKYSTSIVNSFYDSPEKVMGDTEVQAWAKELADAGISGVASPVNTREDLAEMLAVFIFIGSAQHAAANFGQYDEYAFPPNYPAMLTGERPTTKEPLTEGYVVESLPTKQTTLSIMVVTKLLSERGTNALTDFEVQYAYDPHTLKALDQFKADLKEISAEIEARNARRVRKYTYLHPAEVPNAISI